MDEKLSMNKSESFDIKNVEQLKRVNKFEHEITMKNKRNSK